MKENTPTPKPLGKDWMALQSYVAEGYYSIDFLIEHCGYSHVEYE